MHPAVGVGLLRILPIDSDRPAKKTVGKQTKQQIPWRRIGRRRRGERTRAVAMVIMRTLRNIAGSNVLFAVAVSAQSYCHPQSASNRGFDHVV